MATHTRRTHTRTTASGGTTKVRQTQVRTRGAKVAEGIRDHKVTGRMAATAAGLSLGTLLFGALQLVWSAGSAITVAVGATVVFLIAAERYGFMDRRAWRRARQKRPHYRSLRTQTKLWRTKSGRAYRKSRDAYRKRHPVQTALWQRYGAKWDVTLQEPEEAMKKAGRTKPRTVERTGRGHRGRSKRSAEAARHGWATTGAKERQR